MAATENQEIALKIISGVGRQKKVFLTYDEMVDLAKLMLHSTIDPTIFDSGTITWNTPDSLIIVYSHWHPKKKMFSFYRD